MNHLRFRQYGRAPHHSRYRKEIQRYLILLLIPVLLVALLYLNVNHVVTQQAKEYAGLMANHFYVQSSSMLRETQLVGSAILQDSEVARILDADTAEVLDTLHICGIIRNCLSESPYVQQAYLVCEKSGNIYTGDGLYSGSSLSAMLEKIGADSSALMDGLSEGKLHVLNKNGMAPFCVIQIPDEGGGSRGFLIVCLQMTEFLRIFYGLDAELCAIFNENVYISSYIKGANMSEVDWRSEESIGTLVGKPVACEYLDQGDYTYLVAVSRESYERPLKVIIKWFFIYMGAVVVLGYFYLYYVSKKRYLRILNMTKSLPDSYAGDQSFEHIYENIRKSLEDYSTLRENLQIENQEHMLHLLLENGEAHRASAKHFQKAGIDPGYPLYYVIAFFTEEIFDPAAEKDPRQGTVSFLHMLLRSTTNELANQYHILSAFCGIHRMGFAVLYGGEQEKLPETIQAFCQNVVEILSNSNAMSIQATISTPVASVLNLPDAYQEAYQLHSFATSINSSASIISGEDLQRGSGALLNGDFIRQEQILINTILVRKYDAVPSMVKSILSAHISPLRKNYTLAQRRLRAVASVLAEGVRTACVPESAAEQAQAIEQADSVRQLASVTDRVYGQLAAQLRDTASETDIIAIACSYIAQNLGDPNLNVVAICEAAGVSPQRLTRMFQSQFGMAVAEYMNASRIKLAKELLPNRQLTVVQIAQQVGYRNADTFTRNFRKVEGITASEYRKALFGD